METLSFFVWVQIVGAVYAGAMFSAMFFYGYNLMQKAQDETGDESNAPFHAFICAAIGPLVALVGLLYLA